MTTAVHVPADFRGDALPIEADAALPGVRRHHLPAADAASRDARAAVSLAGRRPARPAPTAGGSRLPATSRGGAARSSQRWLAERGLVFTLGAVALLGLGLNLTPCVYPLISVTIAYFGGQARGRGRIDLAGGAVRARHRRSRSRPLGLAAALSGGIFGAALQKPAVVLFIAAVMVALALSSFGALPAAAAGGVDALGRAAAG